MLELFKICSGLRCIYASTLLMCYFVGLRDDVKLADRMRNLRKSADDNLCTMHVYDILDVMGIYCFQCA